uniref:Ig-like domain-containing protein n=1 Tax=Strongyloides venezuelensis TaxID=75913 RepID=A0A0K0EZ92_STRVS
MFVKFLQILLITPGITQTTYSIDVNPISEDRIKLFEHYCDYYVSKRVYKEILTIKFNELEIYKTELKQHENVRFNEIKIFKLSWEYIKAKAFNKDEFCGLGLTTIRTEAILSEGKLKNVRAKFNYEISYSTGYYLGNNFDDFTKAAIWCNIQQCDMGLFFFDEQKNAEVLNNVKQIHTVDYAVLVVIESKDNRMLLGTRPHHKIDIIISLCPYINWVPKKGLLEFIPEAHIKDNGYFEKGNLFAHIVVPFYKKNGDSNEFICGKLKQIVLPDLLIGYTLREDIGNRAISGYINPLHNELKCDYLGSISRHYHFGYMETDTNYMSERIMEPIKVRENDTTYNFYAGQKIYIYNWTKFDEAMKNRNDHERLIDPNVIEKASCIKNLKSDIKAYILPTIGSVDSIKRHEGKNIFYRLIKSDELDNKYSFRCLTKTVEKNKGHMEEFYSRSTEFAIKNEEDPNVVYTSSQNIINFKHKEINNYGSYRCKDMKTTRLFNKTIITMDKVYYLPYEGAEMEFAESHVDDTYQSDIGCNKQYGTFGLLKKITIKFGQNVSDPISIEDFSNSTDTIDIKEGKILYKPPKDILGVTVECTYKTLAETTFYTRKDTFISKSHDTGVKNNATKVITKEKVVNQVKNSSTSWVIGIMIAVILFCIIIIVVAYLIVRRIKKRRAEDSLSPSSFSGVSNLSKSNSKGSRSMSGSKSRTKGGSKSTSKLTASKTTRSGKGSRTGTRSSNVTSNTIRNSRSSVSTNRGKNYYKNVKLAAK